MSLLPEINQASAEINKFVAQANIHQTIAPVNPAAFTDPADTALLASRDPVIREVSVGMTGDAYSDYSVSGTPPLSLPNSIGKPLKAWSVDLLPYQEGTGDPAPDNVRPIHGTDKVTIYTDSKYGGVVEWNQCVVNGNFINDSGMSALNATKSASNNILTLVPDGTFSSTLHYGAGNFNDVGSSIATGHKYYFTCGIMATVTDKFRARISDKFIWSDTIPANTWGECTGIVNITNSSDTINTIYAYDDALYTTNDRIHLRNLMVCDLTAMFGAGNEPSTVEEFRALFPKPYYPYNAGQTMTVDQVNGSSYTPAVLTLPQTVYTGTIGSEGGESRWEKTRITEFSGVWGEADNGFAVYVIVSNGVRAHNCLCDKFVRVYGSYRTMPLYGFGGTNGESGTFTFILPSTITSLAEANQWIADNGGYIEFTYQLSTPDQFALTSPTIPTPTGTATTWATAEDGTVKSMEVTYVGKA